MLAFSEQAPGLHVITRSAQTDTIQVINFGGCRIAESPSRLKGCEKPVRVCWNLTFHGFIGIPFF
jgi:hypothetical protein